MEQNIKTARKISLSIWVAQLTILFLPILLGIIFFLGASMNFANSNVDNYDPYELMVFIMKESVGIMIIVLSGYFIVLALSAWLFPIMRTLPSGKVTRLLFATLIINFISLSYSFIAGFISLFVHMPIAIGVLNSFATTAMIASGIMMMVCYNYFKNFDQNNTPQDTDLLVQQPNWNQNYPPIPWIQPQIHMQITPPSNDPIAKIEQAKSLKDKGLITEEEFKRLKDDALSELK